MCAVASAQSERLEAELERNRVSLGNPVYLNVTFFGAQSVEKPDMPQMDGLRIQYVGPATQVSVVNGRVSQAITHSFLVIPMKEGEYKLGPFYVEYRGETYSAAPVTLHVSGKPAGFDSSAQGQGSAPPSYGGSAGQSQSAASPMYRASAGGPSGTSPTGKNPFPGDVIFLVMDVPKTKVYVNEAVPLTIKLYVMNMSLKDIEFPNFAYDGFSLEQWAEPEKRQDTYRGMGYNVLVFRRNLFGIKEGSYTLGPATIRCTAIIPKRSARRSSGFGRSVFDDDFFSDMFGRFETYPVEIESKPLQMTVLPFPAENKPANFEGAVGDYNMEVQVEPKKVKVGDPVTVRMVISGTGNLDTVTVPRMTVDDNYFKTYEPQVTKKSNTKIYEQVLIPKSADAKAVPGVSFSFFDTKSGKYKTITKDPVKIEVSAQPASEQGVKVVSSVGSEQLVFPAEKIGQDIVHIKEKIGVVHKRGTYLYRDIKFWLAQLIPILFFGIFYSIYRKSERMKSDVKYARSLKAPKHARKGMKIARGLLAKGDIAKFFDVIFKTFQGYLADRLGIPKGAVTVAAIEEKLGDTGYDEETLKMIHEVFSNCDMARYAPSAINVDEAGNVYEKVQKIMDYVEKVRI